MSKIIYRGYTPWINMYALDAYQVVAADERATIHRQWSNAGGPVGLQALTETFRQATRLRCAFWQIGLHAVGGG
jgi:thiaminase